MKKSQLGYDLWQLLIASTSQRQHPFRLATMATVDQQTPEARIIVLREVDPNQPSCLFFAHALSPKVQQLRNNPSCSLLFYDPEQKVQLRLYGKAILHLNDDITKHCWSGIPDFRKFEYQGIAPGAMLDETFTEKSNDSLSNPFYFCVIRVIIHEMDWLQLGREKHQRKQLKWLGHEWSETDVQP